MPSFDEANERLLSALDRLERIAERPETTGALEAKPEPDAAPDADATEEIASLRGALDASRRANAALRSSRDEVAVRLDGAIERLASVLGG